MTTNTMGHRIREIRKRTPGFTQEVLAEAVSVSRVHIARIETGARNPSDGLVSRLAEALDVPVETLCREH